jgi:hypothetical protein
MRLFLPYVFVRFGAYPNHMHMQIIVKNNCRGKKERKNRKEKYNSKEWGLVLGFADLVLDCWLEVGCIRRVLRPANSIKVFLGLGANAGLVPGFRVALLASGAALPMVALKVSHCTNVTSKYGDLALQVGGVSNETVK